MGSPGKALAHKHAKCYPDKGAVGQVEKRRRVKVEGEVGLVSQHFAKYN